MHKGKTNKYGWRAALNLFVVNLDKPQSASLARIFPKFQPTVSGAIFPN